MQGGEREIDTLSVRRPQPLTTNLTTNLPSLPTCTYTLSSRTGSALVWHSEGRRF